MSDLSTPCILKGRQSLSATPSLQAHRLYAGSSAFCGHIRNNHLVRSYPALLSLIYTSLQRYALKLSKNLIYLEGNELNKLTWMQKVVKLLPIPWHGLDPELPRGQDTVERLMQDASMLYPVGLTSDVEPTFVAALLLATKTMSRVALRSTELCWTVRCTTEPRRPLSYDSAEASMAPCTSPLFTAS